MNKSIHFSSTQGSVQLLLEQLDTTIMSRSLSISIYSLSPSHARTPCDFKQSSTMNNVQGPGHKLPIAWNLFAYNPRNYK